jgi:hypothetical protein
MAPYYYPGAHYIHHFRHGPRRLVWFILGGVAATWWMKHKEMRAHERYIGHCVRQLPQPAPPQMNGSAPQLNQSPNTSPPTTKPYYWGETQYEAPPRPVPLPFGWSNQQWEEEKERMWAMGRQAGDTVSFSFAPSIIIVLICYPSYPAGV